MRRQIYVIVAIAALEGLAGVALAAAAAHVEASPLLSSASQFLTIHAAAGLGLAALANGLAAPSRALVAVIFLLQAGVALFSADLASRALGPGRLFPYAAPIGGTAVMIAWAALPIWGIAGFFGRGKSE